MIAKLTKEAAEEADQKSFCDEEIGESKAKQADLSGKLDKTSARIAKAEADKAKLTEDIKTLESEIAEMDAGQAEATSVRQQEHEEYIKASTDFKDSAAAEAKADEESAQSAYDKLTKDNAVTKATKQGDVKGKTNEVKQLEVALGNYKENKATTGQELDAVLTYLDKLKPQCETKAMSYGERKARREQEIAGLKEALTILSGESLLQVKTTLRGARRV